MVNDGTGGCGDRCLYSSINGNGNRRRACGRRYRDYDYCRDYDCGCQSLRNCSRCTAFSNDDTSHWASRRGNLGS